MEQKVKAIAHYNGHAIKTNKMVDLSFKFDANEIMNCIKLIPYLNYNIDIYIKIPLENKPIKIGNFMIKDFKINTNGEIIIKFFSQIDYVETTNINKTIIDEPIIVLFKTNIETEGEENESN
jgi:hypothetical protein